MSSHSAEPAHPPAPSEQLMQLATGYITSACVGIAAQLKIADLVADAPKPVAELARAAQVNEDALYRVLRTLASVSVFTETAPRAFAKRPSPIRCALASGSMRDAVIWMSDSFHFRVYAELMPSVKTGAPRSRRLRTATHSSTSSKTGSKPNFQFGYDQPERPVRPRCPGSRTSADSARCLMSPADTASFSRTF